ncbi:MAG: DUF5916 domain-containing protein, partial [Marinilabilia sp.]
VSWQDHFKQRKPYEGRPPSEETVFKILYDDDFLFVAIRAYDSHPDSIVQRLSRRDQQDGDNVAIHIDSYHDKRTAFVFGVSAAGVKRDLVISGDGSGSDDNWDPIWNVKTTIDSLGWTAEMKIPFTQLRFSRKGIQEWGFQIERNIYRHDEEVHWKLIPKDAGGWVSQFGTLKGLDEIEPKKEKSITPYTLASFEKYKKESENPFRADGRKSGIDAGLNGKFGVTNNLTLDMAVNPDFGQVEADPSQVNLTAYETYFEEKRPFFIEGSNIMDFNLMQMGDFMKDNLFYSRRIGRSPRHWPDTYDGEYTDRPDNTTILGAAKLTGKTRNGWSVGILESMTDKEEAEISDGNNTRYETVEPLSNYFLGRVEKDFNDGNSSFGGILTATNRKIEEDHLDFLNDQAYTGGLNYQHQWKDKTYLFGFRGIFSHVRGEEDAMVNMQESSARYYQRPDASHVRLDSTRNSLTGHGGSVFIGKMGNGNINYALFFNWKSPGLELNDIGYQQDADQLSQLGWIQYRFLEPFAIFRDLSINLNQWQIWDYAGTNMVRGGNVNMNMTFTNYWRFGGGINSNLSMLSKTYLRGGPYFRVPASMNYWWNASTDKRKDLYMRFGNNHQSNDHGHARSSSFWADIRYRPAGNLDVTLGPSVTLSENRLQYIATETFQQEDRYLMGSIDRTTASMSLRVNWSLTPDLSLQYWGQPFMASGDYSRFKRITNSRADAYTDRFSTFENEQLTYDGEEEVYHVDEDMDGASDYSFDDPGFKFLDFKSNLVARWEYLPGSTLYLVWSQQRKDYMTNGAFHFKDDLNQLTGIYPHNVFLVKATYRLGL